MIGLVVHGFKQPSLLRLSVGNNSMREQLLERRRPMTGEMAWLDSIGTTSFCRLVTPQSQRKFYSHRWGWQMGMNKQTLHPNSSLMPDIKNETQHCFVKRCSLAETSHKSLLSLAWKNQSGPDSTHKLSKSSKYCHCTRDDDQDRGTRPMRSQDD